MAERLKNLIEFLLEDSCARLLKRTAKATDILIDTGAGTSLRLSMLADAIELRRGPFVVKDGEGALSDEDYIDAVSAFVEVLQLGSGFYVYSDDLVGFDPIGECPKCTLEVFEWQDNCEICDAKLHVLRPGEDEHDGRAQRVVDVLLRREMIELTSPRGRKNVERTVSSFYAYGSGAPELLLSFFMDMADIAEVYCDEHELHRVLIHVR
jgi:hypothetical protein